MPTSIYRMVRVTFVGLDIYFFIIKPLSDESNFHFLDKIWNEKSKREREEEDWGREREKKKEDVNG